MLGTLNDITTFGILHWNDYFEIKNKFHPCNYQNNSLNQIDFIFFSLILAGAAREQEDPCKTKARVVGDTTYCDRYWECGSENQPELYDCPNGLVFAGKNRGVTEGCDYPWRSDYCDGKQLASKPFSLFLILMRFDHWKFILKKILQNFRRASANGSLRLVVWYFRTWNIMYTLLDMLEWNCYWAIVHRRTFVQWTCPFVRLARKCWWMPETS